jgi:hypothetical protein
MPLPDYVKIKDNYCIAYFGHNKEYIVQLKLLRPFMEKQFPGVKVYLACRQESFYLLEKEINILNQEELKNNKNNFAYIRELTSNMESHPVEDFMEESEIPCGPIIETSQISQNKVVLLTNGIIPVKSLSGKQIKVALEFIQNKGFKAEINTSIKDAGWVVGVENEQLYEAAAMGKQVTLIPTGFGENLFNKMFPQGQILRIYV